MRAKPIRERSNSGNNSVAGTRNVKNTRIKSILRNQKKENKENFQMANDTKVVNLKSTGPLYK
jgi:hypothetical protein